MKIAWHRLAEADLVEIAAYVAADSPDAAYRLLDAIDTHVQQLGRFPASGRVGRVTGTRELVIPSTPFIAVYRIDTKRVTVLRVLHGARRWPPRD